MTVLDPLQLHHARLRLFAVRHDASVPQEEVNADLADGARLELGGAVIQVAVQTSPTPAGGTQLTCRFQVVSGRVEQAAVGVALEFATWSVDEWVFMPACVYAGNRFPKKPAGRTPAMAGAAPDPDNWVTITNRPHLEVGPGSSRIQVLAGDCATPCVGVQSPASGRGLLLMTDQGGPHGDQGLHVEESDDRRSARILVKSPGCAKAAATTGRACCATTTAPR